MHLLATVHSVSVKKKKYMAITNSDPPSVLFRRSLLLRCLDGYCVECPTVLTLAAFLGPFQWQQEAGDVEEWAEEMFSRKEDSLFFLCVHFTLNVREFKYEHSDACSNVIAFMGTAVIVIASLLTIIPM